MEISGEKAVAEGKIERIMFQNPVNGYTIARLAKGYSFTTIVGPLMGIQVGEAVKVIGAWVEHPKFGRQLQVSSFESVKPTERSDIIAYLSGGAIKGVGAHIAATLADRFQGEIWEALGDPIRLKGIPGIGEIRAKEIASQFNAASAERDVTIFFQKIGVSITVAMKIKKRYGDRAVAVVKSNPYQLSEEIDGIGFLTADKIAQALGITRNDPRRARAALLFAFQKWVNGQGHCYAEKEKILAKTASELDVPRVVLDEVIGIMLKPDYPVLVEETNEAGEPILYTFRMWTAERFVANKLTSLAAFKPEVAPNALQSLLEAMKIRLAESETSLAPEQEQAVVAAATSGLLVVTGGPGTGKSFTSKLIVETLQSLGRTVAMCAPTGKAANRLTELTGQEAKTIHRLLGFKDGRFTHCADAPLGVHVVLVDETSMVDILLAQHLLDAIGNGTQVIFVGDVDQLPSVGPGTFLADAIDGNIGEVIRLNTVFRQGRDSEIVLAAHAINHGDFPEGATFEPVADHDFFVSVTDSDDDTKSEILRLVSRDLPLMGFDSVKDLLVLAPMYRGTVGIDELNKAIQDELNPRSDAWFSCGKYEFRPHDKVIQQSNNYDKDVFNGTFGIITTVESQGRKLSVLFDGKKEPVEYKSDEIEELALGYCVSVHKSQGSEFPVVIMPFTPEHSNMLLRNLVYTAVTRGKKKVLMVGHRGAMERSARDSRRLVRRTKLARRLSDLQRLYASASS